MNADPNAQYYNQQQQQQQQQQQPQEAAASSTATEEVEQIPNVRWTFSVCPNSANPSSSSSQQQQQQQNLNQQQQHQGGGISPDQKKSGTAQNIGAAISRAVTGIGTSTSSAYDATHPPPMCETVIPLSCMYTPMFDHVTSVTEEGGAQGYMPRCVGNLGRSPSQCKTCGTFLNKHVSVDANSRVWACPCCFTRNTLPPHFPAMSGGSTDSSSFYEHPIFHYPTVEYVLAGEQQMTPVFLFVVDICADLDELEACKAQLIRSLEWLPQDARIGFMTFGQNITLWELGCGDMNRCYAFRGNRRYSRQDLVPMLGLPRYLAESTTTGSRNLESKNTSSKNSSSTPTKSAACSFPGEVQDRFLCSLSECEFALHSIIEDIKPNSFSVPVGHRPLRATGAALEIATTLLELVADSHIGKCLLFVNGPCTRGPGSVAAPRRENLMRGHKDLQEGSAPLYEEAVKFYSELEVRLTRTTSSLDCFAISLDQVGVLELRSCVNNTGGLFVMTDKFQNKMFAESLQRYFERSSFGKDESSDISLADGISEVIWTRGHCSGFGLDFKVNTSPETKIMGCLGHCRSFYGSENSPSNSSSTSSSNNNLNNISPHRIGISGTNRWLTSCADSSLTFCFVFDTDCPVTSSGRKRFVQIVTKYYATNGEYRARVTSMAMPIAPSGCDANYLLQRNAFDQECAAVVIARVAVSLMEKSDNSRFESIRRWIDRLLVMFCRKFGTFAQGAAESLRIPPGFSLFPAFMFNFRRSEYFMILNISPDETTFKRHYLMRETCDNCTIMVQPVLYSFSLEEPYRQPMPLDVDSIRQDNILLLDAFFNVHIMYGVSIEEWVNANYQEQEDFAHFKELLEIPKREADLILSTRMPYPWFSITGRWGGDSRHFLNRFSAGGKAPGQQQQMQQQGGGKHSGDGGVLFTDDASMQRFMNSLKFAVVSPDK